MHRNTACSLLTSLLLASCSSSESVSENVLDVRSGSAKRTLTADPAEQQYYVLPFSAPSGSSSGQASYELTFTPSSTMAAKSPPPQLPSASLPAGALLLQRQVEAEFKRSIQFARQIQTMNPTLRFSGRTKLKSSETRQLASSLAVYSPFDGEENSQITGTLRAQSSTTAIYVDSREDSAVSQTVVDQLLADFDAVSLPRLHTLFGTESDVDENDRIFVYLAGEAQIGSNEIGLFRAADLLPNGTLAGVKSNEAEIIFSRYPDSQISRDLTNATLAHETFHLINFSEKSLLSFQASGGTLSVVEALFLNEGQAHLAEDLVGWGTCTAAITKIYLECMQYTSVAGSGSANAPASSMCDTVTGENDSLARRGATMLFLLYIFQQLGGANYSESDVGDISGDGIAFLRELNRSTESGIENIEHSSGRGFFSWYGDFIGAVAVDSTNAFQSDPRYNFAEEVTDSFTQRIRNVRMRGERSDAGGSTVSLNGPALLDSISVSDSMTASGSLFLSGANSYLITIPANTSVEISAQGGKSLDMGVTLLKAN